MASCVVTPIWTDLLLRFSPQSREASFFRNCNVTPFRLRLHSTTCWIESRLLGQDEL